MANRRVDADTEPRSGGIGLRAGVVLGPGEVRARPGRVWYRFLRQRLGILGGAGLVVVYLLVIFAPWISPYPYLYLDLSLADPAPSLAHPMGATLVGQDELTRVLYGGRLSLLLALAVALLSTFIGTMVGLVSGYYGRNLDAGLMGFTDLALALPLIPLVLTAGFLFRFSPVVIALALALLLWPRMARLVRAEVLYLRGREYVEAARALGVRDTRIILRHLLPNVAGVVVVEATLTLAAALLTESALSFIAAYACELNQNCNLAPSIKAGSTSLGRLLGGSIPTMDTQWWLTVFPGLFIALTVLLVTLLGDGLRDALDLKSEE